MSGHSHWQTIRRKKEANDAKRGAVFTKMAREIVIAVREGGGGDPDSNIRLRLVLDKARSMGMPKDNIDRAIRRGSGEDKDGTDIAEITYEGYGPNGVAVIIDVVTDNRNRAVAAVRHALTRAGGTLSNPGAVAWQFNRKGAIHVSADVDFDTLFEAAVEAGAEDVIQGEDEDDHIVYTDPMDLHTVSSHLKERDIPVNDADLVMLPQNEVSLDEKSAVQVLKMISALEELDDVNQVFTNLEMTDEALAAFEAAAA
ncbi:MAG TPA: YebC/PmpR family DNA-binding transcriptional regulator [Anaerolineae bacterium]|nr:YebC/PmpR family DNA-binding transcriptional regulator [Anaerolineae bacterium]HQH38456.1 YebC/PmpR family DNA-binding transcriptional regulator [Anaerolineae bacterium]